MKSENHRSTTTMALAMLVLAAANICFVAVSASAQILKPGEIIYSRVPTVPGQNCSTASIWVVGQDGSNDRFITNGLHPRISPDGRLILFKRFDPNTLCNPFFNGQPEWWIRDLTTRQETQIALNFGIAFGHFFSPETNRADKQITTDDVNGLCTMKLDGSSRVCTGIPTLDPIRNPGHMGVRGGDNLIVVENYDNTPAGGLYTLNYNDLLNRQKIPNTNFGDVNPSWSNDGQTIAYATTNVLNRGQAGPFVNLFKINPDGSNKTQLTFLNNLPVGEGFYHSLVWTPDNSTILNAAKINGVTGIYKISANGGGILGTIPISAGAPPEWVGGIAPAYSEQQIASFGGGVTSSGNYTLVDTIGQAFAGQTSSGGTYNLQSGFWTNLANRPPRADFDGDGRSDVSVQRPGDGSWFAIRSSDGGTFTNTWGNPGDVTTPGDFDGDGKTDLAVYRPSSGQWFVLRSSDSSVMIASWGNPGDV
ncbi:MAG: FG-GAP-like repeat-containing protein, partial [Acidobacteriota bacterium]